MATSVANSRMTFGALMGMLTTTANVVTNTVSTLGDGVDMLQNSVSSMKEEQLHRNKVDAIAYKSSYIGTVASTRAAQVMAVQEFRKKSAEHASAYDAVFAEIQKGLSENKA